MSWRPKTAFQLRRVRALAGLFTVANLVFAAVAMVLDGKSGGLAGLVPLLAMYVLVAPLLFGLYSLVFFYWAWALWMVGALATALRRVLPFGGPALQLVAAISHRLAHWVLSPLRPMPDAATTPSAQ